MRKPELLIPAGSLEVLKTCLLYTSGIPSVHRAGQAGDRGDF